MLCQLMLEVPTYDKPMFGMRQLAEGNQHGSELHYAKKKKGMRSHATNQESLSAATKTRSKHSYIHVGEHATEQHPQA